MNETTDSNVTIDDGLLASLQREAADGAREAGSLLMEYFGRPMEVRYKGKRGSGPVTEADHRSQQLLSDRIRAAFPDHAIVGEEDETPSVSPLPDFVWVLDPLDGTRNFSQGLPMFAASVGVLWRGTPVAGAIFIPWPGGGGRVIQAGRGVGAICDEGPLDLLPEAEPEARRLSGLPGGFGRSLWFDRSMMGRIGEVRQTGSIAFELAMVASGTLQYSAITGSLSIWDVAAACLIVPEAGGRVLVLDGKGSRRDWRPFDGFATNWEQNPPSAADLRGWRRPMIFGAPGVAEAAAAGMRHGSRLRDIPARWLRGRS